MIYKKQKKGVEVEYYPEKEAKKLGLKYIPWREARQADQWVLSDDGYVLKTIYVKPLVELQKGGITPRTRYRIKTTLAVRYPHGKNPMNVLEHMQARSYGLSPEPWYQEFDKKYPAIRSMLTKAVISGILRMRSIRKYDRHEYAEMIRIANKIFDKEHKNWYHIRTYFGREEVREQIREDIIKLARKRGIDVDKVFDLLGEAEGMARTKKDAKVLVQLAKEYAAIIGIERTLKGNSTPQLPGSGEDLPGASEHYDRIIEKQSKQDVALAANPQ